jgi:hypothetical protein
LRAVYHDDGYVILCRARVKAWNSAELVRLREHSGMHIRLSAMRNDDASRNKSEQVLDGARRLIETSHRSLAEGSALVRQCRDIIQRAEHALPLERVAPRRHASEIDFRAKER